MRTDGGESARRPRVRGRYSRHKYSVSMPLRPGCVVGSDTGDGAKASAGGSPAEARLAPVHSASATARARPPTACCLCSAPDHRGCWHSGFAADGARGGRPEEGDAVPRSRRRGARRGEPGGCRMTPGGAVWRRTTRLLRAGAVILMWMVGVRDSSFPARVDHERIHNGRKRSGCKPRDRLHSRFPRKRKWGADQTVSVSQVVQLVQCPRQRASTGCEARADPRV